MRHNTGDGSRFKQNEEPSPVSCGSAGIRIRQGSVFPVSIQLFRGGDRQRDQRLRGGDILKSQRCKISDQYPVVIRGNPDRILDGSNRIPRSHIDAVAIDIGSGCNRAAEHIQSFLLPIHQKGYRILQC